MKFKRPASAILAAAMLVSSTAIVSYAAEDEEMKAALTAAKERITIPEAFTEFNYSVQNSYGNKSYSFNWSTPDGSGAIYADVCGTIITQYLFYSDANDADEVEPGSAGAKPYTFGKLTKEELIQKAKEAVETLNPAVAKKIVADPDSVHISLYGNEATVTVNRVENGVKVAGQVGTIRLDKNTGKLTRFYLNWIPGAGFKDSKDAIKKSAAREGFQAEFPIEMRYVAEYDWQTQEYTPHLIFRRAEFGQIDAFTGKKATFEESYDYYTTAEEMNDDVEANPATGVAGDGDNIAYTEQETAKMELEGKLIKPGEKLAEMIKSGIWSIPENAGIDYFNTYYDSLAGAYLISASIRADAPVYESIDGDVTPLDEEVAYHDSYYGNIHFNAETGEILSFYGSDTNGESALKSEKNAQKLIKKYFKEIAGEKAEEFPLDAENMTAGYTDRSDAQKENIVISSIYANAQRHVNGIPCDPESVYIELDESARVSHYRMHYLGLEYPKPENVLETDEVYKKYFDQVKYELLYRVAYNNRKKRVETALVYNADAELYIDAFSGALVNANGSAKTAQKSDHYTDLGENDALREAAEKLALYNITLMDSKGRLNADQAITRSQFASLVRSIGVYYYDSSKNGKKTLTRKMAAKILTEQYADIAELPGLFASPFSDVKKTDKYAGYIAIAAAKGYMQGENGKFRPSAKMTRGEALMLVYNYLSR